MGRKLGEITLAIVFLVIFGLILAVFTPVQAASNAGDPEDVSSNLRIYVHMQPEKANSSDGWFFEGQDVRIKLEMYDTRDNPQTVDQTHPPIKLIDFKASNYKILYVWDTLDTSKVILYENPFQPLEGEHFLFAYAVNNDGIYQTPATKFFIQWRLNPVHVIPTMSQVYVNPEYVKWGEQGNQKNLEDQKKSGQITEEATSTSKIISPVATGAATIQPNFFDTLKNLFSGPNNIWIVLLICGLVLLIAARFLFRNGKK